MDVYLDWSSQQCRQWVQLPKVTTKQDMESTKIATDVSFHSSRLFEKCRSGTTLVDCCFKLGQQIHTHSFELIHNHKFQKTYF
eukprot:2845682-Karenia_brevis.AAC.1